MKPIQERLRTDAVRTRAWLAREFSKHPAETGESYLQHLWFTFTMCCRFLFTTTVLLIHGLFPFLLTRAASTQIEQVYKIMRQRVPKARRDAIDIDYQV